MKKVTKEVLRESANKLMFKMSEDELSALLCDFETIINQLEFIGKIPGIDDAVPMTFPFDITNDYLREDVVEEPLSQDETLKNATDVLSKQIKLPKVVK